MLFIKEHYQNSFLTAIFADVKFVQCNTRKKHGLVQLSIESLFLLCAPQFIVQFIVIFMISCRKSGLRFVRRGLVGSTWGLLC